jgi:FkbM family methyltransferase
MPTGVIAYKLLKKAELIIDIPLSWLELRNSGVSTLRRSAYAERKILRELLHCLRMENDLVVYDIGAHTGRYAAAIANSTAVRQVIAFEPIPDSFGMLKEHTQALGKVTPINLALGDETGRTRFFLNESRASSSLLPMHPRHVRHFPFTARVSQASVEIKTLDEVSAELRLVPPDIIKLDVQGYEDRVIAGGAETFGKARWCLIELSLVELYEGAATFDQLYRAMTSLGFALRQVTDQLVGQDGTPLQINALFEKRSSSMQGAKEG